MATSTKHGVKPTPEESQSERAGNHPSLSCGPARGRRCVAAPFGNSRTHGDDEVCRLGSREQGGVGSKVLKRYEGHKHNRISYRDRNFEIHSSSVK